MTIEAGRDGELNEWVGEKEKTSDGRGRRGEYKKGSRRSEVTLVRVVSVV